MGKASSDINQLVLGQKTFFSDVSMKFIIWCTNDLRGTHKWPCQHNSSTIQQCLGRVCFDDIKCSRIVKLGAQILVAQQNLRSWVNIP